MVIRIGSLFSGIGGFELGLERAIPNSETIWQVEQEKFCQKVLAKHWPNAKIYDDVRNITKNNVEPVDILCGGFPCQDISVAGKGKGINEGEKSSLWWEMHRIISELRPRVVVLENVPAITFRGLDDVLGSLSQIGYDAEWCIISARDFGAPHLRKRWFCVAYPHESADAIPRDERKSYHIGSEGRTSISEENQGWQESGGKTQFHNRGCCDLSYDATNPKGKRSQTKPSYPKQTHRETRKMLKYSNRGNGGGDCYWQGFPAQSPLCRRNDGVSNRVDRIKALGNAIVPQCSQWIGERILESGLLEDLR